MDAATFEAEIQALDQAIAGIREADRQAGQQIGLQKGRQAGRREMALQNLVDTVARHGALSPDALEAYRVRLETSGERLPNAVRIGEYFVRLPHGPIRAQAVQTFVDTGRLETPDRPATDTPPAAPSDSPPADAPKTARDTPWPGQG